MATVAEIFNQLVELNKLTISTGTRLAHDNLRTRLCKLYSQHKDTMASIGYSDSDSALGLCASFDSNTGLSEFSIAIPARKRQVGFEIVEAVSKVST